jgi:GMP synthase (glutamine-hydrolysing)
MVKSAYVIQHIGFEDLGSLENVLQGSGYSIKYFDAAYDDIKAIDPDLLIILGGPVGVYDNQDYSFIDNEISLLKNRINDNKPTLGICLGAQLIAKALGAKVYFGGVKEIGWGPITLTESGNNSFFKHLIGDDVSVLHWHGDTFDLPQSAVLCAKTDTYPNQGFVYKNNILALQFHPEVTEKGMERWFVGHANEINACKLSIAKLREDTHKYANTLQLRSAMFFREWLERVEK